MYRELDMPFWLEQAEAAFRYVRIIAQVMIRTGSALIPRRKFE